MTHSFTEEELEDYRKAFDLLDKDGTGGIEPDELAEAMKSLGLKSSLSDAKAIIAELDKNKDGKIDFVEFLELMAQAAKEEEEGDVNQELLRAFQVFDVDGSGTISARELRQVLASQGDRLTRAEIDEMIKHVDLDGDGLINYREFALLMGHK